MFGFLSFYCLLLVDRRNITVLYSDNDEAISFVLCVLHNVYICVYIIKLKKMATLCGCCKHRYKAKDF